MPCNFKSFNYSEHLETCPGAHTLSDGWKPNLMMFCVFSFLLGVQRIWGERGGVNWVLRLACDAQPPCPPRAQLHIMQPVSCRVLSSQYTKRARSMKMVVLFPRFHDGAVREVRSAMFERDFNSTFLSLGSCSPCEAQHTIPCSWAP